MQHRWLVPLAVTALVATAFAQSDPAEQARRLLEDGRTYREQGKLKQALDNFNTIVNGFPDTDSIDDAMLEIGRYHVEVEGDVEKGRLAFEQVTQRFPQSDGAPGAYFYLGWVTLNRAAKPSDLDDALAQFTRVQRLYPRSPWVARALNASGLAHRKAQRYAEAVAVQRQVSMEYPTTDVAADAQFEVGQCLALMGEPRQAMEEFQQVRNRFPDSGAAREALNRITALYRLHASSRPSFSQDASYSVGSGDVLRDVRAILAAPDGTVWLASDKTGSVVPYGPDGKAGSSLRGEELRGLSLAPTGELLVAAKRAVRIGEKNVKSFAVPGSKPGELEELEDVLAAVETQTRSLLIADKGSKRIHRYAGDFSYKGTFPDSREREAMRMQVSGEGDIVILDALSKGVYFFDEQGRSLQSVGLRGAGYEIKKPVDIAVDAFRNLYVADEEGAVLVFSREGRLMATVGKGELQRPKAMTLDASGAILVYDDKQRRVVRYN